MVILINNDEQKMSSTANPIQVLPYNPNWPDIFKAEAQKIQEALGDNCITIHHIGSTSVPGLAAKPVIDMIPVVKDIELVEHATSKMEALGYEAKGEYGMLFRRYFRKENANIHIYEQNSGEIERCVLFRDWMRTHPEDKQTYADLKTTLATQYPEDILKYCFGKEAFVISIDEKTGFSGVRMVKALTPTEWEAYHRLQKTAFEVQSSLKNDESHFHWVLYKGTRIACVAYLEFLEDSKAKLGSIKTEVSYQNQDLEATMTDLLERWIRPQGRILV